MRCRALWRSPAPVLLQPDWMCHLGNVIELTRLYPARLFAQEVRHPWLCFALLWFRAQRRKERRCGQSFPCVQPTHTTRSRTAPWLMATSATGRPVHVSLGVRVYPMTKPASQPFSAASSLSRTRILSIDHASSPPRRHGGHACMVLCDTVN
jgi:hypothetical protein